MKNNLFSRIIFPLPVGLIFMLSTILLENIFNDWGGIPIVLGYIVIWLLFIIPVFSVWYTSLLVGGKKMIFGFSVYNALTISVGTLLLLFKEIETFVFLIIMFVWVFIWTLTPALIRLKKKTK